MEACYTDPRDSSNQVERVACRFRGEGRTILGPKRADKVPTYTILGVSKKAMHELGRVDRYASSDRRHGYSWPSDVGFTGVA
jgi:hypothetical protein